MNRSGGKRKSSDIHVEILEIRGHRVMLDSDLAKIYGIPTHRLNEAVKRNKKRFPIDFMFRLSREEVLGLTSQNAISKKRRGGRRTLPYAFTEHGAIMAASILNSERAVHMSIYVVRAFVRMRSALTVRDDLREALRKLEKELTQRLDIHESAIVDILTRIMELIDPPEVPSPERRRIGY